MLRTAGWWVTLLVAGTVPTFAASGNATSQDVLPGRWAYQYVQRFAEMGILEGYPDGRFRGQQPMTRYEFAVALARAIEKLSAVRHASGEKGEGGFQPFMVSALNPSARTSTQAVSDRPIYLGAPLPSSSTTPMATVFSVVMALCRGWGVGVTYRVRGKRTLAVRSYGGDDFLGNRLGKVWTVSYTFPLTAGR
ncbi:MAG: S-layer homology domain-containing protein [Abditibacteriales bacterium]|nr:S-layer homology domain-containing protein [Abditibacteriales bacterium]MDW8365282.1 S-layer homology domain-containing protein [Abditibacteriales bacterium]